MEPNQLKDRTIKEIVSSNYVFASILYYFGIHFFEYSEKTLKEVCRQKGIEVNSVLREFSKPELSRMEEAKLRKLPVDLLIEFLKHSHYVFAKKQLPYLAQMIQSLRPGTGISADMERDLKMVFPMFVEDFIQHLYMEEDTFFVYVMKLYKAVSGKAPVNPLYFDMKKYSVSDFASDHDVHDDEMEGIREITNDYFVDETTPLQLKVLYSELQAFEKELVAHARIEDHILMPKALGLENEARRIIGYTAKFN